MKWVYMFLPAGLMALAGELIGRDKNTTGPDDAFGQLIGAIAPTVPQLIEGTPGTNATQKTFLAIHRISATYLQQQGLLSSDTAQNAILEAAKNFNPDSDKK